MEVNYIIALVQGMNTLSATDASTFQSPSSASASCASTRVAALKKSKLWTALVVKPSSLGWIILPEPDDPNLKENYMIAHLAANPTSSDEFESAPSIQMMMFFLDDLSNLILIVMQILLSLATNSIPSPSRDNTQRSEFVLTRSWVNGPSSDYWIRRGVQLFVHECDIYLDYKECDVCAVYDAQSYTSFYITRSWNWGERYCKDPCHVSSTMCSFRKKSLGFLFCCMVYFRTSLLVTQRLPIYLKEKNW